MAAALVRASGEDDDKINDVRQQLSSALKSDGSRGPFEQLFLALICKRQGDARQADVYLREAELVLKADSSADDSRLSWNDRLEASLLRREINSIR